MISIHSRFKLNPVLLDPHTIIPHVFNALRKVVIYNIINIQHTSKHLCSGQQNDAIKFRTLTPPPPSIAPPPGPPGGVNVICSINRAIDNKNDSGNAVKLPGGAHNDSCRFHHAVSIDVCPKRLKYAFRDSATAAHNNGIAAIPRGMFETDDDSPALLFAGVV